MATFRAFSSSKMTSSPHPRAHISSNTQTLILLIFGFFLHQEGKCQSIARDRHFWGGLSTGLGRWDPSAPIQTKQNSNRTTINIVFKVCHVFLGLAMYKKSKKNISIISP